MKLIKYSGLWRFISFAFWKIQILRIVGCHPPLNIVETFDIDMTDEEAKKMGLN